MKRDFLSYIFSGNLWPYGHVTAASIQSIQITTPKLLDFEERVVHAEERSHHDAILQKLHDYVWEQIEIWGEAPIRRLIGEIEKQALNSRPRTVFDPPRREFLRKYFNVPVENVRNFPRGGSIFISMSSAFRRSRFTSRTGPRKFPSPRRDHKTLCALEGD
jgi:hypothetical protein